ncbi:hypothetical protein [Halobacterium sp. R2-5]|uniref:hypothetical protein n=1 Tax=Halobacterium sp. R2-5 TaxID=2715751 RepID=UPI0014217F29|nr:hypothetical protein [Halobacterium sp. R2-5]NIC00999.1 hypothetical protein [Halobacterium sp. R2-5]
MGKTRATYRDRLQGFENDWKVFRHGLIREYQPHWDEILVQAHQHAHAAGQQNPVEPNWGIVFSMLVSQEKRIAELETKLEEDNGDD